MRGVLLETNGQGTRVCKFVHHSTAEWEITSDVAVSDVPTSEVSSRKLPGRLGAYIYPRDAVFSLRGRKQTRTSDFMNAIRVEEQTVRDSVINRHRINHISVETCVNEDAVPREEDTDDDEVDEEEDAEECVECEDPEQWVDVEEPHEDQTE